MISVTITRRADGRIAAFAVEGHSNYAKSGRDIVCAGVSAITVGTVNSIEALTGVELPASMKDGWLQSDIPQLGDEAAEAKLQLLLESMVVMLDGIRESYGKYIDIQEQIV
ncbi:ribosomal-processing cysteine protease Prp [Paenibacillus beijingensis]|uniref:Ribosomal processing cysteine protease Prp n=1 Tax=Paenibacillus beijingensis TaxID=1126833 RepID=A0A0D5NL39_9BACL|nr:ribosomal-processing cysteine protease Prp [Paenibacillus beijingensis]AJY76069.1 ribosomal protein [Paenibacillus beijingensis]